MVSGDPVSMALPRVFERSRSIYGQSSNQNARQLRSAYLFEGLGEQAVVSVNCGPHQPLSSLFLGPRRPIRHGAT